MKKWFATVAICAISLATVHADVTVVQTMTMEGGAAAMMPPGQMPKMTMRIKGMNSRTDIDAGGMIVTAITDLASREVILLMPNTKTAQVITPAAIAAGAPVTVKSADASVKPTGRSQTIDGVACDEFTFALSMNMAEAGGAQMPPEAAAAMKDVQMIMNGSMWVAKAAPGAAEWMAFYKAAADSKLLAAVSGMKPGQPGGLDKLLGATAAAPGIPYRSEMTMRFEGSGPMVEAMKKMGDMKIIQKVSSVSTAAIPEDVFKVPEGYTIEKK